MNETPSEDLVTELEAYERVLYAHDGHPNLVTRSDVERARKAFLDFVTTQETGEMEALRRELDARDQVLAWIAANTEDLATEERVRAVLKRAFRYSQRGAEMKWVTHGRECRFSGGDCFRHYCAGTNECAADRMGTHIVNAVQMARDGPDEEDMGTANGWLIEAYRIAKDDPDALREPDKGFGK